MADDGRTYIRLHDGMPDHPKVEPLSDKAFRLLVETWCWSSRHLTDGSVPAAVWARRGTAAARRELVTAGLVDVTDGSFVKLHDYLEHQRSRAEVEEISAHRRASKQAASKLGNHRRWHVGPGGKPSADCEHCLQPSQKGSQVGSQTDPTSDTSWDRKGTPQGSIKDIGTDRDTVKEVETLGGGVPDSTRASAPPAPKLDPNNPRCPRHREVPPGDPGPPCRACRDVRLEHERHVEDPQAAARRAFRAAVDACGLCDDRGMLELDDGSPMRCDHTRIAS